MCSKIGEYNVEIIYKRYIIYANKGGFMFEYDPNKSQTNKQKHGIDFEEAQQLWEDKSLLVFNVQTEPESRQLGIARLNNKYWSAIFTLRGNNIRIISVRRARKKEIELYETNK